MKFSLQEEMSRAIDSYPQLSFKQWCLRWPGQVVLATSNIYWTAEVTQVSSSEGLATKNMYNMAHILKG